MPRGLPDSWITWGLKKTTKYRPGNNSKRAVFSPGASTVKYAYKFSDLILYQPQFETMINGKTGMVGRHVRSRGHLIVAAAKRQVGVKTGSLRKSIVMVHTQHKYGHKLWIGSNLSYAHLHHEGSRPHQIVAEPPKMLRFNKGTRVIHTRMVNHPGTKPNRYLSDQIPLLYI